MFPYHDASYHDASYHDASDASILIIAPQENGVRANQKSATIVDQLLALPPKPSSALRAPSRVAQPAKVPETETGITQEPTDGPASLEEPSKLEDALLVNLQNKECLAAIVKAQEQYHDRSKDAKGVSDYLEDTRALRHILARMLADVDAAAFEDVRAELAALEAERTPVFVPKEIDAAVLLGKVLTLRVLQRLFADLFNQLPLVNTGYEWTSESGLESE